MKNNPYIGHSSQLCSVEEVRLIGGRGDGMRLLQIRNATGMELTVSEDRCADLSRLIFKGVNMGYFTPNGYVAPAYYDDKDIGWLKSFTAGFLTTCGLNSVGAPCEDAGEILPQHGSISNTPCEHIWWTEDEDNIYVHAKINDSGLFSRKLYMHRTITCGKQENRITIEDTIENQGDTEYPAMLLYHMNMGYPLLSENAVIDIPSVAVTPRNERAAEGLNSWKQMLPPTPGFEEQCYDHTLKGESRVMIYNPDIHKGVAIEYDADELYCFTQWKMMGARDYVLGLEPGNTHTKGRDLMRKEGKLKILQPGESVTYKVTVSLFEK